MKNVGIFGGTFDPVHKVHLELAERAQEQFKLDTVLFIPTGMPARKLGKTFAKPLDRLNMLKVACSGHMGFEVSPIEVERTRVSYTVDTLHELQAQYEAEDQFFLIVGEDAARDIGTWKDAEEIASLATILYAKRPDQEGLDALPQGFRFFEIEMPEQDISSSTIRNLLQRGKDVSALIPAGVLDYIKKHDVYGHFR